jgi:hypothetical protein
MLGQIMQAGYAGHPLSQPSGQMMAGHPVSQFDPSWESRRIILGWVERNRELAEFVNAASKLLDVKISALLSPHDDQSGRLVHSGRGHKPSVVWAIKNEALDVSVQWLSDHNGGDEAFWRARLAEAADLIKAEKDWYRDQGKELPKGPLPDLASQRLQQQYAQNQVQQAGQQAHAYGSVSYAQQASQNMPGLGNISSSQMQAQEQQKKYAAMVAAYNKAMPSAPAPSIVDEDWYT